jgi:hypothetical protein
MAKKRKDFRSEVTQDQPMYDPDPSNALNPNPAETAEYIVQMCAELRTLAKSYSDYVASMTCELATLASSANLERLMILLDNVRKEAETAR